MQELVERVVKAAEAWRDSYKGDRTGRGDRDYRPPPDDPYKFERELREAVDALRASRPA